jgi:hypothetical protein
MPWNYIVRRIPGKQADNNAVILRIDADVGCNDGPFNGLQHVFFPWLDGEGAGIGYADVAYLAQRRGCAVIIYRDAFQHLRVGFAGPYFYQFAFQVADGFVHRIVGHFQYQRHII